MALINEHVVILEHRDALYARQVNHVREVNLSRSGLAPTDSAQRNRCFVIKQKKVVFQSKIIEIVLRLDEVDAPQINQLENIGFPNAQLLTHHIPIGINRLGSNAVINVSLVFVLVDGGFQRPHQRPSAKAVKRLNIHIGDIADLAPQLFNNFTVERQEQNSLIRGNKFERMNDCSRFATARNRINNAVAATLNQEREERSLVL